MASMMSKGGALALAIGIGAAVAAGGALAHNDKMPANASPATKTAYARHENFEKLGAAFKGLNDEMKKGDPSKAVVATNAKTIATLAGALPTWFPRGSGVEARAMSEAKPDIWRDAAGFSTAASNFQAQATKLNQLAAAGDIDGVKGQIRNTGMTCKGCHDKYRLEKKD
ncbi:MAG: cytochrome c [Alphaproteobacteria bacterium]|nr:cytochrome c [Alphaproteobacteria bacterium]MBU1514765.1 cytochrome c [Alphaproteobacteria bacterium]MBU2093896.1 cytochrome c [Alphaproteobacteria bacterium]MBU2153323.1 cytochrome c [Alphaproteobacteria bacterium]MBU2309751.1 cytochrome c [Alphaproteobacteria bacterium]